MRLPSNWRSRIEIATESWDGHMVSFQIRFIKGRTPRGFCSYIGSLEVDPNDYIYVEGVELEDRFRGRGLGRMLYEYALCHYGRISTRYSSASEEARRVWLSLIRDYHFETDFFSGRLTVYNRKRRRR